MANLLDTDAAAARLGIKATTLNTWRSTRKVLIPFIKIGSRVLYDVGDLDQFVAENRRDVAPVSMPGNNP